ncbi:hypothetical protein ACPOL_4258 [Acidisarcina polymorpha]|uniref:Uncharacterized protein n=1 Tax=Acidisarcina polymorpha TaxID=2211140 RepID=A0A2Z5G2U7_9BACT|nr:hypothetical protein ACPOL_4258 [Acidisarcina polymorpha]
MVPNEDAKALFVAIPGAGRARNTEMKARRPLCDSSVMTQ